MKEVDNLAQLIRQVDGNHTMGAGELAEHIIEGGYRKLEPHIIRTVEELQDLAPLAVLETDDGTPQYALDMIVEIRRDARVGSNFADGYLPAVVLVTGEQVRAARQALEKEPEQDNA